MLGNYAVVEGALAAGCDFFAGYPITPANEISERMASRMPDVGGKFLQGEDELCSIYAVTGASLAGAKAMTASRATTAIPMMPRPQSHHGLIVIFAPFHAWPVGPPS